MREKPTIINIYAKMACHMLSMGSGTNNDGILSAILICVQQQTDTLMACFGALIYIS
jgi:hypothetical protein